MRRFILIFMMCLLPLQWSWAAAARVCEHEQVASHFGHHAHEHGVETPEAEAGTSLHPSVDASLQAHADCHTCHGICVGFLTHVDAPPPQWPDRFARLYGGQPFPEPPPASLLRPPSLFVA